MDLRKETIEIKKFNKFQLIKMTNHAFARSKERDITVEAVKKCISHYDTRIIQYHKPHKGGKNKDELFLLRGKVKYLGKRNYLHIVIAKNIEYGIRYRVVTCYIPDKDNIYNYHDKISEHDEDNLSLLKYAY